MPGSKNRDSLQRTIESFKPFGVGLNCKKWYTVWALAKNSPDEINRKFQSEHNIRSSAQIELQCEIFGDDNLGIEANHLFADVHHP
jgi:hypothetical protein